MMNSLKNFWAGLTMPKKIVFGAMVALGLFILFSGV